MSDHDDFAFEPVPGLPAALPAGERILWQGRPDAGALAREAFKTRWVIGYFAVIFVWRLGAAAADMPLGAALATALPYLALGLLAAGILRAMAWAQARATVYTLTDARIVMRIGAALPVTINLPFAQVAGAALDLRRDGTGTIAFQTVAETKLSYVMLWPHARPWRTRLPEPALRCVPDAARIAQRVAEAAETRLARPVVSRAAAPAVAAPAAAAVAAE
jgi:hypothetical protein